MAHRIAGEWRGHYHYRKFSDLDSGFTAFITENGGTIEGTIIDDQQPSNATFTGSFSYPSLHFTKVYADQRKVKHLIQQGKKTMMFTGTYDNPVEYEGSMSEDGKSMSGTWTILGSNSAAAGTWIAYRVEEEEKKQEAQTDTRVTETLFDER